MSILDLARRFYNYVAGDDSEAKAATKTKTPAEQNTSAATKPAKQNSVMPQQKLDAPVDKVVTKSKVLTKAEHTLEITKKMANITKRCKKLDISLDSVLKELGKKSFIKDFIHLSHAEKLNILNIIEQSLNDYEKNTKNEDIGDLDKEKAIAARVSVAMNAIKTGTITDAKELSSDKVGNINNELGHDYETLSEEEKNNRLDDVVSAKAKEIADAKYNKNLKNCKSEKAKENVLKEKAAFERLLKRHMVIQFSEVHDENSAADAVKVLDAGDMDTGIDYVLNTKISDKAKRTEFADRKMTVEYVKNLLNSYYEKGQTPPKEVLEMANRIIVSAKSFAGVQQYDNDFYQFRLECEENGNPPYISDEQLTAMSTGIGLGITFNENLTVDEKACCINDWDEHANHFSDYCNVKSSYNEAVKQYLKEHPEAAQGVEKLETKLREKYGKVPDLPRAGAKRAGLEVPKLKTAARLQPEATTTSSIDAKKEEKEVKHNEITSKKAEVTPKEIAESIKNGNITITDAINKFHEKAFDAIFEEPELFAQNRTIAKIHINNFRTDLKKLLTLSNFSSAIELIAKNISPIIKEQYAQEVKLSGITRNAIFGKDENNAAA